jgi:ATP-dependent DNA helicase RecG
LRGKIERRKSGCEIVQAKIYTINEYYEKVGKRFPIYPLTTGLTNSFLIKIVKCILENMDKPNDYISADMRRRQNLISYEKALKGIHFPESDKQYKEARERMVFDEFFRYTIVFHLLKEQEKRKSHFTFTMKPELAEFRKHLPFEMTSSQKRVYEEVVSDLCGKTVMNRLIQGDVGSGKTIIAVMVLLLAAKNDTQGAFMVPTEVLAAQHFHSLRTYLEPYGVRIGLLTGSQTAKEKRTTHQMIRDGSLDIVVGTHAVIQDKVVFHNLSVVITDEQHRFGVKQRDHLYGKGREPHVLAMSATPIPRTLALMMYGDMDLSVIDCLPEGRLPIKNCVVGKEYRRTAYHFIQSEVKKGHQAYIICPMVDESDTMELASVTVYAQELKDVFRGEVRIGSLHGKMKGSEKNRIMNDFAAGIIDVLVSTTVIEVGIDVKNATVILIENAERFGLAGLHQLRGRVGRGKEQSYCILMTETEEEEAKSRLNILAHSNDGFVIASEDLKLRGQGDLLGVRQSGETLFKIADIFEDAEILKRHMKK